MERQWIHEEPAQWDDPKQTLIGGAPEGIFVLPNYRAGDLAPGDWWRVEVDGQLAGYGWMDTVWGDAEVLLVVAPDFRGKGVGTFIMDHLEQEARTRGLNYLYNVVRPTHPDREGLTRWLLGRKFSISADRQTLRRGVAG
jgi:GNAT superfamily N-acetyltransferase